MCPLSYGSSKTMIQDGECGRVSWSATWSKGLEVLQENHQRDSYLPAKSKMYPGITSWVTDLWIAHIYIYVYMPAWKPENSFIPCLRKAIFLKLKFLLARIVWQQYCWRGPDQNYRQCNTFSPGNQERLQEQGWWNTSPVCSSLLQCFALHRHPGPDSFSNLSGFIFQEFVLEVQWPFAFHSILGQKVRVKLPGRVVPTAVITVFYKYNVALMQG